jgi:hypothetical protein
MRVINLPGMQAAFSPYKHREISAETAKHLCFKLTGVFMSIAGSALGT